MPDVSRRSLLLAAGGSALGPPSRSLKQAAVIDLAPPGLRALTRFGESGLLFCGSGLTELYWSPAAALHSVPAPVELRRVTGQADLALNDLQAACRLHAGSVLLAASHSRTAAGDAPEDRFQVVRLVLSAAGALLAAEGGDGLLQTIVNQVPFLADSLRRTPALSGLNLGGMAWDGAGLMLGLRAPTITESRLRPHGGQEDAVLLQSQTYEPWLSGKQSALGETRKIDLRGQGIHDLAWDAARAGHWILSGLSAAPTHAVRSPWSLWFLPRAGEPIEALRVGVEDPEPLLTAPSGLALLPDPPRLLLLEAGEQRSRCAVIPASGLAA